MTTRAAFGIPRIGIAVGAVMMAAPAVRSWLTTRASDGPGMPRDPTLLGLAIHLAGWLVVGASLFFHVKRARRQARSESTRPNKRYDEIADVYHLVYEDWPQAMRQQAEVLGGLLERELGEGPHQIVDVSCGIGTQALGLAALGHTVAASDVSAPAIDRARREALERDLAVDFSVADMRECDRHHEGAFDAVISCDDSIPHLLTDDEISTAFRAFFRSTRPGGVTLVTVRDYAREDRSSPQIRPFGVRTIPEGRVVVFQVWDWDATGERYELAMYFVRERADEDATVLVSTARYYAVSLDTLSSLLEEAGFDEVERIDDEYVQPMLLARRAA